MHRVEVYSEVVMYTKILWRRRGRHFKLNGYNASALDNWLVTLSKSPEYSHEHDVPHPADLRVTRVSTSRVLRSNDAVSNLSLEIDGTRGHLEEVCERSAHWIDSCKHDHSLVVWFLFQHSHPLHTLFFEAVAFIYRSRQSLRSVFFLKQL